MKKKKTAEREMGTKNEDDRPEFYRIIRGEIAKKEMRIPPVFIKDLAGDISDSATLACSSGGRWQVAVRKRLTGTYFEDGWEKFVRENELGDTEFLVFRYDGNMNFHVQFFDKNGIKRSAPIFDEEEISTSSEKNGIKRSAPNISDEEETNASNEKNGIKKSAPNMSDEEETSAGRAKKCLVKPAGPGEISVSLDFTSKFPHFERCMNKSCVQGCLLLAIPQSFSSTHLPQRNTKVFLRNSEGKIWEVNCIYHSNRHSLSAGWGTFVRDNDLRLGDTCIFELVAEDVMQVHKNIYLSQLKPQKKIPPKFVKHLPC